ncbi:MAG: hypothetical protein JRF58_13955 [Deltaproteobacteria bacterium]|nr:hypothetical protein [Deltaproteobacteria bacterium]
MTSMKGFRVPGSEFLVLSSWFRVLGPGVRTPSTGAVVPYHPPPPRIDGISAVLRRGVGVSMWRGLSRSRFHRRS